MVNSDQDQSGTAHSLGKKVLCLLFQYVAEKGISYFQTENQASGGRATGSRGRVRQQSENPHQNRNFRQNSGQNRQHREAGGPQSGGQRAVTHVKKSGRGGSFRDPATPHSPAPRGNGGDGGRGSGGRGGGGRVGAHHVARQPAATTAALGQGHC
ncbi:DEAD-box ATP-dependent RNA helicase 52A-like isoform X2 [Magnolia sinica]|uniref:DEAD-box ATP-dependent RNA helicase 52A-like isoform X2 n=1 Tax=Magnolia sinica TaxID=86752 RepID=UPI0026585F28|nr:DEAD-box ATP-dependent RNA helicase 52A-like isoform X2 [Magnolia sinica]